MSSTQNKWTMCELSEIKTTMVVNSVTQLTLSDHTVHWSLSGFYSMSLLSEMQGQTEYFQIECAFLTLGTVAD